MGGIDTGGGGHGGKKSVNQELPLVPFIDLLFCCIMFLIATAVWNQLARINANQSVPGEAPPDAPPPEDRVKLILQVQQTGYILASTAGDSIPIPKNGDNYDRETLRTKLDERKRLERNRQDIIIAPEDGVRYEAIIQAMDDVVPVFPEMSVSDGAAL